MSNSSIYFDQKLNIVFEGKPHDVTKMSYGERELFLTRIRIICEHNLITKQ